MKRVGRLPGLWLWGTGGVGLRVKVSGVPEWLARVGGEGHVAFESGGGDVGWGVGDGGAARW